MKTSKQVSNDYIKAELRKLSTDYLNKLPKKLSLINDIWQKLSHYSWNDDAFSSLHRLVHGLTGSGKTFGLDQLSVDAKIFEDYIAPLVNNSSVPTDKERGHIESLLRNIANSAKEPVNNPQDNQLILQQDLKQEKNNRGDKTIYIVDDDKHISLYLSTLLSNSGYQVQTFSTPNLAIKYIDNSTPDAVIMDIVFPTHVKSASFDAVEDIRDGVGKRVPFLFVSARTDLAARTTAVRAGGDAYFTKPINFLLLLEKLDELTDSKNDHPHRILIVDDDVELSQYHALLLKKSALHTEIVNKPIEVMKRLEECRPDLILMDLYMPDYDGLELASVIRQDASYVGLPIVFLSSESNIEYHNKAFDLGVNEFLVKPISQDIMVDTINRQIRLSQKIRGTVKKISKIDPINGLHNRQYFLEQLDFAVSSSVNADRYQALYDISLINVETLKEKFGIEWLEPANQQICSVINSCISDHDIATHFSDSTYFFLTDLRSTGELIQLAEKIRNKIDAQTIRVGCESIQLDCIVSSIRINEHISSVHDLLQFAEETINDMQNNSTSQINVAEYLPQAEHDSRILKERISAAIKNKSFKLAYQPIISVEHRSYEMFEVLVRMLDNDGKVILPSQFLSNLNHADDMLMIDRWVVENAISSLAADQHARSATDLFIKITSKTLYDNLLIPSISNSLTEGGITGESRVFFHINENDIVGHLDQVTKFADMIGKINCGFSIDHFGETKSYEKILQAIKPDFVKIRGSVYQEILTDKEVYNYVKLLVEKAQSHNVKVIAASIEDPATLSVLWNLGVRYFQGYFIKEPDSLLNFNFLEVAI